MNTDNQNCLKNCTLGELLNELALRGWVGVSRVEHSRLLRVDMERCREGI